ncbi:MAG TPA: M1 family metallopeptidase [Longimicrobiales bacterium]|nr:M1 family metallopeptidase [Longimicrobiales bacterium]
MRAGFALALGMCATFGASPVRGQAVSGEPAPIRGGRAAPAGTYGDVDVIHYDAVIGLPAPGGTVIEGVATLTLRATRPGVAAAVLDFTGLGVTEVSVDGTPVEASHERGRLAIPLPGGAGPADTFAVRISYRGTPDDALFLGRNVHGEPVAFVDNWPNRTRFWLPTVDHPSDKATASFAVYAPEGWRVISNGRLVEENLPAPPAADGSTRRAWRWRTDVAVSPYNFVFGAARMDVRPVGLAACGSAPASPRPDGCVEVSAWLFPEDVAQANLSFRRAAEMVDFYTDLIGPYPFEKLAHVESSTRFGGMENASAIFYTEQGLASGRNMEGTVAHETAHQWFGDSVTEADWPELWLSEGFATYFGHLYFEHAEGVADFRRRMEEDRRQVLASADVSSAVIDREEQDLFALLNDNNYPKGGWVLHMLRGILGDETFFQGIRRYYAAFAGETATTQDLRAAMEGVSGKDLGWFFQQWLEEPGYPALSLTHAWDASAGEVVVTVRQTQEASWPAFRLPLEIEVRPDAGGTERHEIELTGRAQTFRFRSAGPARQVALDPDGWVLFGPGS